MTSQESIAYRYGKAQARKYVGQVNGNKRQITAAQKVIDQITEELPETIHDTDISAREIGEIGFAEEARNLYDFLRVSHSAYTMQAVAYTQQLGRYIEAVIHNEAAHNAIAARPLIVIGKDEEGRPLGANGEPIEIELVDLSTLDPEDEESFSKAIGQNDTAGRYLVYKHIHPADPIDPHLEEWIDRLNNDIQMPYHLIETKEAVIKQIAQNTRKALEESVRTLKLYQFAADILEAYWGVKGLSEVLAPPHETATALNLGVNDFNYFIELITVELTPLRFNAGKNPKEAGAQYVDTVIERIKEWFTPIGWYDPIPEKEAKKAAKKLELLDISSNARFFSFLQEQAEARGL